MLLSASVCYYLLFAIIRKCFSKQGSKLPSVCYYLKQEVSKFINYCNETKAATLANKEGGQLSIVKTPANADNSNAKKE